MSPTMSQWQLKLAEIYPNQKTSPDYMMVHLVTKCSELGRIYNHRKDFLEADIYVLRALSWLLALCTHFSIQLEGALVARFPRACPYCTRCPCCCHETGKRAIDARGDVLDDAARIREVEAQARIYQQTAKTFSFDEFRHILHAVYPSNRLFIRTGFYAYPLGKLDEEKGELHKAYSQFLLSQGSADDIAREAADVFSWLVSFWAVKEPTKSLDDALAALYVSGCPSCKNQVCICPMYSFTKGEEELLREIVAGLRKLKHSGIASQEDIDEALNAATTVADEPDPKKRASFFDRLGSIANSVKSMGKATSDVKETAQTLSEAREALVELFK